MLRRIATPRLVLLALCLAGLAPSAAIAQAAKAFDPAEHLPAASRFVVSIPSVSRLRAGFAETLPGRFLSHPRVHEAVATPLALLRRELDRETAEFRAVLGRGPFELLDLFRGGIALSVRGLTPQGVPELSLAVELGESRDALLDVLGRLQKVYEQETGSPLGSVEIQGLAASTWPTPAGPILQTVLGDHLVFATSIPLLDTIVQSYAGDGASEGLRSSAILTGLRGGAGDGEADVELAIDVAWALQTAIAFSGGLPPEAQKVISFLGVDSLTSAGFRVSLKGGVSQGGAFLGMRDGGSGLLGVLANELREDAVDVGDALAVVPAGATRIGAASVNTARVVRAIEELVGQHFPDVPIEDGYAELEQETGISRGDLLALGKITVVSFQVPPPAGGLIADSLLAVRTDEIRPYIDLGNKIGAAAGLQLDRVPVGGLTVVTPEIPVPEGGPRLDSGLLGWLGGGSAPPPAGVAEAMVLLVSSQGLGFPSSCELPTGWTLASSVPQSLQRYALYYSKSETLTGTTPLAKAARKNLARAGLGTVFEGSSLFPPVYNTILHFAPMAGVFLGQVGLRLHRLPPAEVFVRDDGPGFMRVDASANGVGVRFRGVEGDATTGLVAVAVVGLVAGVAVPTMSTSRIEAYSVECGSNLKMIHVFGSLYGDKTRTRMFPHSPEGYIESLQLLVDAFPEDFRPEMFNCMEGEEVPAEFDENGRFRLSRETCSYRVVPWKLKTSTPRAVWLFDRHLHVNGKRNVVFTDGSVQSIPDEEFRALLKEEKARYGTKKESTEKKSTTGRRRASGTGGE